MNLITPLLDETEFLSFSYPINKEFENCVAFSEVQAGLVVAYGSSNMIVVLIGGKFITDVLYGHKETVCTVSFDMRKRNIISCDISGQVFFWYYQDLKWQRSDPVKLDRPFNSVSWYSAKREICYSNDQGLFHCLSHQFDESPEKLCSQSSFCTFNFDGSLLASHNRKTTVTIFMFTSKPYLTQVVRHPTPVELLDFHPYLPAFMTISKDNVLRIWRQSVLSTFACTAAMKVPFFGYFVRYPVLFSGKSVFGVQKPTPIVFLEQVNDKNNPNQTGYKLYKIKVDENGRILLPPEGNPFQNMKENVNSNFKAIYRTNSGTQAITVDDNKISIISKNSKNDFIFHSAKIKDAEFAPESSWLYTLDENKLLIIWPIFNPYEKPIRISDNASLAVWKDAKNLVFLENSSLKIYCTDQNLEKDHFFPQYEFPEINNCRVLYSNNDEIFAITNNSVLSKEANFPITEFSKIAISKPFNNQFIILFSKLNSNQVNVLLCPSMQWIKCSGRPEPTEFNNDPKIQDVGVVSIAMFVVLTQVNLEFWSYRSDSFECVNKVYLPGMNGIYCDTSSIGGRILAFNNTRLFSISNGVVPMQRSSNISKIVVSSVGHVVVFWNVYFRVYPSWCIPKPKPVFLVDPIFLQNDQLMNVGNLTPDAKFLAEVTTPMNINYMISPTSYANPPNNIIGTIQATLFHLLECHSLNSLSNCTPEQVPAIPNQYTIPSALVFPDKFLNDPNSCKMNIKAPECKMLIDQLSDIKEDIDLFGYRYLLAIKENAWPPSYFALWLSFSQKQSQVAQHLYSYIDTNMLSKFYIPASIHQHSILVNIVQHALKNMWAAFQKVDNVALLYAALGQTLAISKLYNAIGDDQRADFFKNNFKTEKWRKSAIKNAYSSLSHHNNEMSATLFLVAGDIKLCLNIVLTKLNDPLLGLLVVRLITHSDFDSDIMKYFLSKVEWNDDHLPVLISNLMKDGKVSTILEKLLLDNNIVKNMTGFGDRRITLFEIYHHITKKADIVPILTMNLNQDGLAPLSNYIYGLINSPFETFRAIESPNAFHNDAKKDTESDDDSANVNPAEDLMIEKVESFDFGGGVNWEDDEWSDDESSSENENTNDKSPIAIPTQSNNSDKLQKVRSDSNEIDSSAIFNDQNTSNNIFEEFLNSLTFSLCCFFNDGENVLNNKTDGINSSNISLIENAGEFAMRASSIFNAFPLLSEKRRQTLLQFISNFIDCCCKHYYESTSIPLTPIKLLKLILQLLNVISGEKNCILDLKSILQYKEKDYIHSIYNGSVVAALWTYNAAFLIQLLDESIEPEFTNINMIQSACSFYDIDIDSPKFPDSIPHLLPRYTSEKNYQVASLERDRILIMLLLFERVFKINRQFDSECSKCFLQQLSEREHSMIETLLFYEISLGSPLFEQPPPDKENKYGKITSIIDEEYSNFSDSLGIIQEKSLQKQPFPPIFRNGELSVNERNDIKHQFSSVKSIALMPLDSTKAIVVAELNSSLNIPNGVSPNSNGNNQIFKVDLSDEENIYISKFSDNYNNVIDVIPHPSYNLFVALTPNSALLFDYPNDITDYKIQISQSQSQIMCAAFSPNGSKLAICTTILDIFSFDLSKWETEPTVMRDMKSPITAVEWINSDTSLAVAYSPSSYDNGNSGIVVIVNTLTKFNHPIEIKKEWGQVTSLSANIRRSKLVIGTRNGYAVITNMKLNFECAFIISLGFPISSIRSLQELSIVGTENGNIVIFSTEDKKKIYQFDAGFKINSVTISEKMFLSAGDSTSFAVWNSI